MRMVSFLLRQSVSPAKLFNLTKGECIMKTNYVPAIIMLCAGFVDCLMAIKSHLGLRDFITELLAVLVIFYILGLIIKFVLDLSFNRKKEQAETEEPTEESLENIDLEEDVTEAEEE